MPHHSRRLVLASAATPFLASLFGACATANHAPLQPSPKLHLNLTDGPPTAGPAPFAAVADSRKVESHGRVNTDLSERYGDSDFAVAPVDAIKTAIAAAVAIRRSSKQLYERMARSSLELLEFECRYIAMTAVELEASIVKNQLPGFQMIDRALFSATGRQGSMGLVVAVSIDGKRYGAQQVVRVAGSPPPGPDFVTSLLNPIARRIVDALEQDK